MIIFLNIENNLREIGHGDVTVNKMKNLNQIFHDLLIKFFIKKKLTKLKLKMTKYLFISQKDEEISIKLNAYLSNIMIFVLILLTKI